MVWSDADGPHEWTGTLGTVFHPFATLQNMNGACALDTPCSDGACYWSELLGGSVPGAIFVEFMLAVTCNL